MVKVFSYSELNKTIIGYCKTGNLVSLKDLYRKWGSDVILKARDSKKFTTLLIAMVHEQTEVVAFIIDSLKYFDEVTFEQDNKHYLHIAADLGRKDYVDLLLRNDFKINDQDENGYTPLHFACYRGHKLLVEHLLDLGADSGIRNIYWRTAAEEAISRGNTHIASFIENGRVKDID